MEYKVQIWECFLKNYEENCRLTMQVTNIQPPPMVF